MNATIKLAAETVKKVHENVTRIYIEDGVNQPGSVVRDGNGVLYRESVVGPRIIPTVSQEESAKVIGTLIKLAKDRSSVIYEFEPTSRYDSILKSIYESVEDRFADTLTKLMSERCNRDVYSKRKFEPRIIDNVKVCGILRDGKAIYEIMDVDGERIPYDLYMYKDCIRRYGECKIGTFVTKNDQLIRDILPVYLDQLAIELTQFNMRNHVLFHGIYQINPASDLFYYVEVRCENAFDIIGYMNMTRQEGKDCILIFYEIQDNHTSSGYDPQRYEIKRKLQWDRVRLYNGVMEYYFEVPQLKYDREKMEFFYEYKSMGRLKDMITRHGIERDMKRYEIRTKNPID